MVTVDFGIENANDPRETGSMTFKMTAAAAQALIGYCAQFPATDGVTILAKLYP